MSEPVVNEPTEVPSSPEPAPISLSESGNPVGESSKAAEPAQSHEPIPTGDNSAGVSGETPQIISSPALPDVKLPEASTPDKSVQTPLGTFIDTSPTPVKTAIGTFTNTSASATPSGPSGPSAPAEVPGITFKETIPPPPETTIAPQVPPAPAQTGILGRLKGLFGK